MKNFNIVLVLGIMFFMSTNCTSRKSGAKKAEIEPVLFPAELVDFVPATQTAVFSGTGTGTWDHKIRERGYILKEDGIYKMWYTGFDESHKTLSLGYATSDDGMVWKRFSQQPILMNIGPKICRL